MVELSEKLTVIFHNVNDWLKYAEAKNAILLAFAGAGLTANVTLLTVAQNLPASLRFGLIISTSLLCLCAFLCSLSFLPKTDLEKILWIRTSPSRRLALQSNDDNFYYFGHLRKYTPDELLGAINKLYLGDIIQLPYEKECRDIAAQITVNSEIAFLKFRFFTYSSYLLALSIGAIPIIVLVHLIL
ncbi:MAG: hypothetical protein HC849_16920 [Oscillatoriales cyanobacterium RU_3_3]|nr:hypothetical protein [Leptolyngbyaceae cyanobacterium SU_3_3]NJL65684.1 hypothetical protein [Microcoleus sp. SM1_3_4]NJM61498.1 hypothetical protein [Oscillatoriales cyanobacterium RU_3_3]